MLGLGELENDQNKTWEQQLDRAAKLLADKTKQSST